jgi:hypothetical protein
MRSSTVQRTLLIAITAALVVWLGAAQLAASAAYGDLATKHSLPSLLHRIDPHFVRAALLGGGAAHAAAAIHTGDLTDADTLLAHAPPTATTLDLRGQLAQARGAHPDALADYVAAGDFVRAQAQIDAFADAEPLEGAREEHLLITQLQHDPSAGELLGQAWWRLGVLQATAGYVDPPHRTEDWRAAQTSYEHALTEAPNDETYLLATAYQELANGDLGAASTHDLRALAVDPASAPAHGGLAFAAAANGDCARARAEEARARTLAPNAAPLTDNPTFGARLAACLK